jgi:hypothetical protein
MMSSDTNTQIPPSFANMRQEQLPIPKHKLHGWTHFVGLYAAEHVAATEFVIGATFVALGASTMDIVVGLLIGNVLAILSWTLITAPIAVDTRLSLFTYLHKMGGDTMTNLYNWANVLIFTVISAAMLTVSFLGGAAPVQYTGSVGLVSQQSVVRGGGDCGGGGCGSGRHVRLLHADGFLRGLRALVVCHVHQRGHGNAAFAGSIGIGPDKPYGMGGFSADWESHHLDGGEQQRETGDRSLGGDRVRLGGKYDRPFWLD